MNSSELNEEDWYLKFSINNENYSLNIQNDTFFQEVKKTHILKVEKPDKNIHAYIKTIYNYDIEIFIPLNTRHFRLFVFDMNNSEECNSLIYIVDNYYNKGGYSLFYRNPKNYEYNQLFRKPLEISNNPSKYSKEDDQSKYFFMILQPFQEEIKIITFRETNNILMN